MRALHVRNVCKASHIAHCFPVDASQKAPGGLVACGFVLGKKQLRRFAQEGLWLSAMDCSVTWTSRYGNFNMGDARHMDERWLAEFLRHMVVAHGRTLRQRLCEDIGNVI